MHSKERKRSPEQFILAGFPLHDNLNPGLKTHKTTSTTPDIGRPGRVLLPYSYQYTTKNTCNIYEFCTNFLLENKKAFRYNYYILNIHCNHNLKGE